MILGIACCYFTLLVLRGLVAVFVLDIVLTIIRIRKANRERELYDYLLSDVKHREV